MQMEDDLAATRAGIDDGAETCRELLLFGQLRQ